jgi:glycosyltransferase involved in cell wall biosynthesis
MFLGSIVQRKGLSYLLDAVRSLRTRRITVLLRGRGTVDSALLHTYRDIDFDLQLGLPTEEIVRDLQRTDLFVLPSLVEGFAHVILQAMQCGVPVLTTDHTCGPDVIVNGREGFIVPIRDAAAVAAKLEWGIGQRNDLYEMGLAAAQRAREFTWQRFRAGIRAAYRQMNMAAR